MTEAAVQEEHDLPTDDEAADMLPKPAGFQLLIALPEEEEVTQAGIILPEETRKREMLGSICGLVLEMGPDAYKGVDRNGAPRFPSGPYCKRGEWVMMKSYSGVRFMMGNREFRLINDDSVLGTVLDPKAVVKA